MNSAPFSARNAPAPYIVLVLVMAAACGPHRIPRDDMEDILYRMLVQDQQIKQNPQLRRQVGYHAGV